MSRPIVDQTMIDRFAAYHAKNPAWGDLHIVLSDFNLGDSSVDYCVDNARDDEGRDLAIVLRSLTKTQRGKIAKRASR